MTSLNQDIKSKLSQLNVLEKIIVVNVGIFLLALLLNFILTASKSSLSWFELPSDFLDFIIAPWSIITYAFIHYDFFHILFNMLWLYIIGQLFLNLFNPKLALNVYFLGAISGGLLFVLCYSLFPQVFSTGTRLVGASASVRALLIFLCAYLPSKEVRFFTFNLKLWYFGLAIVILDVLGLFGNNTGGNLAHIGGAALGYFYAVQLRKGVDIGKGFERFMDAIIAYFKTSKKAPLKTVHKNKSKVGGYAKKDFDAFNDQKKIDVILDK
jgi:membrane associated rhomboid family serine protease